MKIKGFTATLYYWSLILAIFILFNGINFFSWKGDTQGFCGLIMGIAAIVAHALYWNDDHGKENKEC